LLRGWPAPGDPKNYSRCRVKRWGTIERPALRKLELAVSSRLDDLRVPPGNRSEALAGDRAGRTQ
jgi:proteic killer suppression protein